MYLAWDENGDFEGVYDTYEAAINPHNKPSIDKKGKVYYSPEGRTREYVSPVGNKILGLGMF